MSEGTTFYYHLIFDYRGLGTNELNCETYSVKEVDTCYYIYNAMTKINKKTRKN